MNEQKSRNLSTIIKYFYIYVFRSLIDRQTHRIVKIQNHFSLPLCILGRLVWELDITSFRNGFVYCLP